VSLEVQGETTTAGDVLEALKGTPWFPSGLGACRLAVNHAFADDSTPIRAADEVALIGMVSGG
jgi:molybdopterin converting factor small subunit